MPTSLKPAGYEELRQHAQSEWTWVALVDDAGSEVTRIDILNDSRASWSSDYTTNPLEATITIHGGDADIDVAANGPITLVRSESYESQSDTNRKGYDTFADVILETEDDELTLSHQIEIPP